VVVVTDWAYLRVSGRTKLGVIESIVKRVRVWLHNVIVGLEMVDLVMVMK
jgi:hypothetical protein